MIIIDQRSQKGRLFKNIDIGECFLYGDNVLYMKIDFPANRGAVALANGTRLNFNENEVVTPVEAEIYISQEGK